MKKSPFEKITKDNAPGVDSAVKMPIEKGFNDDAGRRIAMGTIAAVLSTIPSQPGTPIGERPKPIIGKPGKPKPGKPGDNFEGPLPGPRLPGKPTKPEPGMKYPTISNKKIKG